MNAPPEPRKVAPLAWPSDAILTLPGSKSEANRALVAAALSGRPMTLTGATPSDDVVHCVKGLAVLGFESRYLDETHGVVRVGPRASGAPVKGEIHCGNAGTAMRFLLSVAAITPGTWILTGDAHMRRRPIEPLVDAWKRLGVNIDATGGCPPVYVRGDGSSGGRVELDPAISSQYLSSLLLVGAHLPKGLDVRFTGPLASAEYAQLTREIVTRFGVEVDLRHDRATVRPGAIASIDSFEVGGDWSAMGVWSCLNHLTGSRVRASNLRMGSHQTDEQLSRVLETLHGSGDRTVDVKSVPDQFMNLAVVAARREGTTRLVNAANLRNKECDRISVMARELARVGVDVREFPDGLVVHGAWTTRPSTVQPESDHRVAMAFALAGLLTPGIAVAEPGCVAKSYPGFWQDLDTVTRQRRCVAVVGMRGVGKSTVARAIAERSRSDLFDLDAEFERRHGAISAFVKSKGWDAFRDLEEKLLAESLTPGRVVDTGGGVVEQAGTRARLKDRAVVVWLDSDATLLRERLAADPGERPSVTGAPMLDELDELLARRGPLYAEIADVRIDARAPVPAQVEQALTALARPCRLPVVAGPKTRG